MKQKSRPLGRLFGCSNYEQSAAAITEQLGLLQLGQPFLEQPFLEQSFQQQEQLFQQQEQLFQQQEQSLQQLVLLICCKQLKKGQQQRLQHIQNYAWD